MCWRDCKSNRKALGVGSATAMYSINLWQWVMAICIHLSTRWMFLTRARVSDSSKLLSIKGSDRQQGYCSLREIYNLIGIPYNYYWKLRNERMHNRFQVARYTSQWVKSEGVRCRIYMLMHPRADWAFMMKASCASKVRSGAGNRSWKGFYLATWSSGHLSFYRRCIRSVHAAETFDNGRWRCRECDLHSREGQNFDQLNVASMRATVFSAPDFRVSNAENSSPDRICHVDKETRSNSRKCGVEGGISSEGELFGWYCQKISVLQQWQCPRFLREHLLSKEIDKKGKT